MEALPGRRNRRERGRRRRSRLSAPFRVSGLVVDPDGALCVGDDDAGELYRIAVAEDGSPGRVEIVAVDGELLTGPDGIQWHDGGLLIVENTAGTCRGSQDTG